MYDVSLLVSRAVNAHLPEGGELFLGNLFKLASEHGASTEDQIVEFVESGKEIKRIRCPKFRSESGRGYHSLIF